jgi:Tfp pilus assembly protein PilX
MMRSSSVSQIDKFRSRLAGDDGVALLVAIALIGIVGVLSLTVLAFSLREVGLTGHDRQRTSAITTAEGTLDNAIAQIQSAKPALLPCSSTGAAQDGADQITIATTITYYNGSTAVSCAAAQGGSPVSAASVKVTGTSGKLNNEQAAVRSMETLISMTPTYDKTLNKAIFADSGISLSNNGTVYGESGKPNADLYTNGNFACANNQTYHGSIYAKGQLSMSGSCTIDGDAYAGTLASGSSGAVGGNLKIVNGNLTIGGGSVGGKVYYSSPNTVSWSGCGTLHTPPLATDKCQTLAGMVVPSQTFPQLLANAYLDPGWAANGFTSVVSLPNASYPCAVSGKMNGPAKWIMDNGPSLTAGTILRVNCPVEGVWIDSPSNLSLKQSLAVFSNGPMTIAKVNITSTNTTPHNLYLIQPYDSVSIPCTTTGISLDNQVTIDATITELLYTPCNITKANNSTHYGQIYAGGTATISNKLTMYYEPVPVWGVSSSNVIVGYDVSTEYKRES